LICFFGSYKLIGFFLKKNFSPIPKCAQNLKKKKINLGLRREWKSLLKEGSKY